MASDAMKALAFGGVLVFLSQEVAGCIAAAAGEARHVPVPEMAASAWREWFAYAAGAPAVRVTAAVTALCYLGRDIDRRAAEQGSARAMRESVRSRSVPVPAGLKAAGGWAAALVIADQLTRSVPGIFEAYRSALADPGAAARIGALELASASGFRFSAAAMVAGIAFHYMGKDIKAALIPFASRPRRARIGDGDMPGSGPAPCR